MRAMLAVLVLAAVAAFGSGCQNVARLGCEGRAFYLDMQRVIFGIDYPHGNAESTHSQYFGMERPGRQNLCVD